MSYTIEKQGGRDVALVDGVVVAFMRPETARVLRRRQLQARDREPLTRRPRPR